MKNGNPSDRITRFQQAAGAPGSSSLPFDSKDEMETLVALHRRRMELMATLHDLPSSDAAQDRLRIRQAANRLYFEIHRLDKYIRQQHAGPLNRFAEGEPMARNWRL